jgi:2-deoxy-D-gluconate 3-dehydrogenase
MERILVTGAASRVGQAIAEHLSKPGREIIVHYRTSDPTETIRRCEARGARAIAWQTDLRHVTPTIVKAINPLDHVILNASTFIAGTGWYRIESILRSSWALANHATGSVTIIGDEMSFEPVQGMPAHCWMKFAQMDMARVLRVEYPERAFNVISCYLTRIHHEAGWDG